MFTLKVRIPCWTGDKPVDSDLYSYLNPTTAPVAIKVNGTETEYEKANGYALLHRQWAKDDVVEVSFPMDMHQVVSNEKLTTNNGYCSYERGPIVYCAESADNTGGLLERMYIPKGADFSTATAPTNLSVFRGGMQQIKASGFLCTSTDEGVKEVPRSIRLIPYFARANRGATAMRVWIPFEAVNPGNAISFIDEVKICDEESEQAHNLKGENMNTGTDLGWRDAPGGWISYDVKVDPERPNDFVTRQWGGDGGGDRNYNIYCDGTLFSFDDLNNFAPGEYYYKRHPIPFELTKGKKNVTVRMQAASQKDNVGGLYGVYTTCSENVPDGTVPVDYMWTSDEASVSGHNYDSNGGSGDFRGRKWMDGSGEIGQSWDMKVNKTNRNYLMILFWGGESDVRNFDIYCDDIFVASESLYQNDPGRHIFRCYPIPEEGTSDKEKVRIHLTSPSGTKTGGFFYSYMMSAKAGTDAIRDVTARDEAPTYYNLQGVKLNEPSEGINIVSTSTGTKKIAYYVSSG